LDTSRFKSILSKQFDIDARNIHAYIIGEHGDSEIASWSLTKIAGMSVDEYCLIADRNCGEKFKEAIQHEVKHAAYEIINRKGYTNYAVALAVRRISEAILHDEQSILTVSGLLQDVYGISDVYLAMPCVVGKDGISKILPIPLSSDEIGQLQRSANLLKDIIEHSNII
jgi:L-lactate dehydrogenase